eukprot:TRINITY_DN3932_c0_g1_i1.p1 TRINITY_DN3932_c0_g1~~TRINITY_DN3932_c0_g1_i1.p1  ORF type:complete len:156 (-),score=36.27 TRINITY_DN3932_c0_g1_i1:458-925(-)
MTSQDVKDTVTLVTSDESKIKMPKTATKLASLISLLVESGEGEEIALPNVGSSVMSKVVEFLNHHNGVAPKSPPKPLPSNAKLEDAVEDKWDQNFLKNLTTAELPSLMLASNYCDIPSLMSLLAVRAVLSGVVDNKDAQEKYPKELLDFLKSYMK